MLGLQYMNKVDRIVSKLSSQSTSFSTAAALIVDSATQGGYLYVHDPEYMISIEAWTRAAGLCLVRQLRVSDLPSARYSKHDVAIVFSNASRIRGGEEVLYKGMRERGFKIIGVFPKDPSSKNHPARNSLEQYSDIIIASGIPGADGLLSVPGFSEKLAPVDTVVNSIIVFSICAEVVGEFLRRRLKPSVYMSLRTQGGREHNTRILNQYKRQGF